MKKILTSALFLLGFIAAHAQYMSFFGDSTWEYHITYLTNPPDDYIYYPPEVPSIIVLYSGTITHSLIGHMYMKTLIMDVCMLIRRLSAIIAMQAYLSATCL